MARAERQSPAEAATLVPKDGVKSWRRVLTRASDDTDVLSAVRVRDELHSERVKMDSHDGDIRPGADEHDAGNARMAEQTTAGRGD